MILKRITVKNYRSFGDKAELAIDRDITVLTGGNDTGKSMLLRLVALHLGKGRVTEDDLYQDTMYENAESCGVFAYEIDDFGMQYLYVSDVINLVGDTIESRFDLRTGVNEVRQIDKVIDSGADSDLSEEPPIEIDVANYPRVVFIDTENEIGSVINVEHPERDIERTFLETAFGTDYLGTLNSYSDLTRHRKLMEVENRLTRDFIRLLPSGSQLSMQIRLHQDRPIRLSVLLTDGLGTITSFRQRGSGFRKLLTLFVMLQDMNIENERVVILLDEPENSLHADAQHSLRGYLELIASHRNVQVIYATHSPAMIYRAFPNRLRLLTREQTQEGIATTRINNEPYTDENFQMIRSSLGVSPADSLLYAPISVIVEGATESLALNRLFRRLKENPINEIHDELHRLIDLIHFLGAGGSSFVRWAKMADSQGSKAVVFVDGDQINNAKALEKDFGHIPIIHFDETKEFEDIVPREVYFEALAEYAASNNPDSSEEVSLAAFEAWEKGQGFHERFLFSKRVAKWYNELFEYDMEKAEVMDSAIERVKLADIDMTKIDELINEIREAAENLH